MSANAGCIVIQVFEQDGKTGIAPALYGIQPAEAVLVMEKIIENFRQPKIEIAHALPEVKP